MTKVSFGLHENEFFCILKAAHVQNAVISVLCTLIAVVVVVVVVVVVFIKNQTQHTHCNFTLNKARSILVHLIHAL